ncbi:MAG TPA: hypothetical protein PLF38_09325, partial [Xylanibacter oryzae]|nr:hypothetical protein [Xylanibacter oryzae]
GVGFKYGWGNLKLTSKRKTYNNLVVYNKGYGMVEQNLNNATLGPVMEYSNNTIYKSKNGFIISPSAIYDTATGYSKVIYRNNLVYNSTWGAYYDQIYLGAWKYPDYDYAVQHHNTWKIKAAAPYFEYNDTVSWSYDSEDAQFIDLPADSAECVSTLSAPRKSTGYLPDITLFRLTGASTLIGAGYNVGMSATPDIGIDWNYSDATYGSEVEEPPSGDVAPTVYSNTVTPKSVQATTGGNVTSDGGATVTERGVVWGTSANPTTSGNKKSTTGTTGLYSVTITGLKSNTTYHVRSYAINAEGTSYGADVLFTTPKYSPATSGGKVIYSDGKVLIIK